MRRLLKVVAALTVITMALFVGFYWFFLRVDAKPKAAILKTPIVVRGKLDGTWTVFPGIGTDDATTSWVGYRVNEHLATAITNTIVGRSKTVDGSVTVRGSTVSNVTVTADTSKLVTDRALRDTSVRGALDTARFPNATFRLTSPIHLPTIPKAGALVRADAVGDFTMHGVTRRVTIPLSSRWDGQHIEVIGALPIVMADYRVSIPEVPGLVRAEDRGTMEFQLFLDRKP